MKTRIDTRAAALALVSALVLAAPARAIRPGDDPAAGERFRRPNVSIDTETRLPDGGALLKGAPAEVEIESLGNGKVRATFFQGGARKGEANGIIVVASPPAVRRAVGVPGKGAPKLSDLGLDPNTPYSFVKGAGKVDFVLGNPGANQIQIALLLPAVQAAPLPPQSRGAVDFLPSPTSSRASPTPRRSEMRSTLAAILLSASAAASAMPTAVERGVVVQGGLQFQIRRSSSTRPSRRRGATPF